MFVNKRLTVKELLRMYFRKKENPPTRMVGNKRMKEDMLPKTKLKLE